MDEGQTELDEVMDEELQTELDEVMDEGQTELS